MARHKTRQTTVTTEDAVSQAQSIVEELSEEMATWRDNMEERLSHTDKYERVSEAADALENVRDTDLEVPEALHDLTVGYAEFISGRRGLPRWARLSDAVSALQAAADEVNEIIGWCDDAPMSVFDDDTTQAFFDDLQQLATDLEQAIGECEGVEFPGMFG